MAASDLPVFDTALVLEEIAKGCYVTAMAVLGEVGVQTRIIATYAPESIKRRILPAVCTGECILAICMTEPDAGTDVANYKTNTDIIGDRLRLNGVKTLISRAEEAEHVRRLHAVSTSSRAATASAACWSRRTRPDSR